MPQMSPLMWANLFIIFSLLLLVSFIKIYFSNSKTLEVTSQRTEKEKKPNFSWTW